ncbi:hypothetical protein ACP4OV_002252 [Aristida adscensionis]
MMNKDEDILELRRKHIVNSFLSDQQTLEFFKGLAPNLIAGPDYWRLMFDLEEYKQKRRVWIAIYKFVKNNTKTIAAVLSVIGILLGIFKALYSFKQHQ